VGVDGRKGRVGGEAVRFKQHRFPPSQKTRGWGTPFSDVCVRDRKPGPPGQHRLPPLTKNVKDGAPSVSKGVCEIKSLGHPPFADQALSVEYMVKNYKTLEKTVYKVPDELDKRVAKLKLESMGIKIDRLSPEQEEYLAGWSEGT
jgi:hypothetical protein